MFGGDGAGEIEEDFQKGIDGLSRGLDRMWSLDRFRSHFQTPPPMRNDMDGFLEGAIERSLRKQLGEHDRELDKLHRERERLSEDMQRRTKELKAFMQHDVSPNPDSILGFPRTRLRGGDSYQIGNLDESLGARVSEIADGQDESEYLDGLAQRLDNILEHVRLSKKRWKRLESSLTLTGSEGMDND